VIEVIDLVDSDDEELEQQQQNFQIVQQPASSSNQLSRRSLHKRASNPVRIIWPSDELGEGEGEVIYPLNNNDEEVVEEEEDDSLYQPSYTLNNNYYHHQQQQQSNSSRVNSTKKISNTQGILSLLYNLID